MLHGKDPDTGKLISLPAPSLPLLDETLTRRWSSCHTTRESPLDYSQGTELAKLEQPFSDNFTARVCVSHVACPVLNAKGFPKTAMDIAHEFCRSLGWRSGKNSHDLEGGNTSKYFISRGNQPGGKTEEAKFNSILKIATADIPLVEVFAVDDFLHSARREERYMVELVKETPNMRVVGEFLEGLKQRHPRASLFKNHDNNLAKAAELAAKFITPVDQDITADLAGSPHIPKLEKLLVHRGYTMAEQTIGNNGLKTEIESTPDGLQFKVMVYDKVYETLQQPGKSKDRSLDSKVHLLVNPSTMGLKKRFAHQEYQDHGLTRVEITFIGSGWTGKQKLSLMGETVAAVRTQLVSKSIHNHTADMDLFLKGVTALYMPEAYRIKRTALQGMKKEDRKAQRKHIDSIPEAAVVHWTTETTGKRVGRVIASEINLVKGQVPFQKTMDCLAFESPCNVPINLYILVSGLDDYMQGGTPTLWLRRLQLAKCSDIEEQNRMLVSARVCKGSGQHKETDVQAACGVVPYLLSHVKLAVMKENPTYANTHLYLQHLGTPSVTMATDIPQLTFKGRGSWLSLPETFVNVNLVEDKKRGKMGRPRKTDKPYLAFEFQGDRYRFPDEHQNSHALRKQLVAGKDFEGKTVRVRYTASQGFEYEILFLSPQETRPVVCAQGKAKHDSEIPVQAEPMKILSIRRVPRFKGFNYELDLGHHGRFMGPPTLTKNWISSMTQIGDLVQDPWPQEGNQDVYIEDKGYFLQHTTSKRGPVKGGKGRDEEFIQIFKGQQEVLRSEGTKREREDQQGNDSSSKGPRAKRTKQ